MWAIIDEFKPEWIGKMPNNIQVMIVGFVALHAIGLGIIVIMGFAQHFRSKEDFKTKLI
jgi:hypothetical protein